MQGYAEISCSTEKEGVFEARGRSGRRIGKASLGGWCTCDSGNAPVFVGQVEPWIMRMRVVDSCRGPRSGLCGQVTTISAEARHIGNRGRILCVLSRSQAKSKSISAAVLDLSRAVVNGAMASGERGTL